MGKTYRMQVKPLSVNKCWQGRRFKTIEYKRYEREVLTLLGYYELPEGEIELTITAGFSSRAADLDNFAKPFIDILQKKYGFNDNRIYKLILIKDIVKKGSEYLEFEFKEYEV